MSTPPTAPSASPVSAATALDGDLLRLLRCPVTKSVLKLENGPEGEFLVAEAGGLKYPVREGIPVMLVEEAVLPAGFSSLDEFKKSLK